MIKQGEEINASDFVSEFIAGEAIAVDDAVAYCVVTDSGASLTANRLYKTSAAALNQRMNFIGFAITAAAAPGDRVKVCTTSIYTGLSGLTADTPYYLSNTQGALATTPGTYTRWVGISNSTTTIDRLLGVKRVVSPPIAITDQKLPFDCLFTIGSTNAFSGSGQLGGVNISATNFVATSGAGRAGDELDVPSLSGTSYAYIYAIQ